MEWASVTLNVRGIRQRRAVETLLSAYTRVRDAMCMGILLLDGTFLKSYLQCAQLVRLEETVLSSAIAEVGLSAVWRKENAILRWVQGADAQGVGKGRVAVIEVCTVLFLIRVCWTP